MMHNRIEAPAPVAADARQIIADRVADLHARTEQAAELALVVKVHVLAEVETWLEGMEGAGVACARRHLASAATLLGVVADLCAGAEVELERISAAEQLLLPALPGDAER